MIFKNLQEIKDKLETIDNEISSTYFVERDGTGMYAVRSNSKETTVQVTANNDGSYSVECKDNGNVNDEITIDDLMFACLKQYLPEISMMRAVRGSSLLNDLAFKCHVLVEGDRGSGKTYEANQIAMNSNAVIIRINGSPAVESFDLLGGPFPVSNDVISSNNCLMDLFKQGSNGNNGVGTMFVWKDGPLTRAFRLANNGSKVIIIFDELLRVPARELNILLSALSPIEGRYYLPTGRIIRIEGGIGVEETVTAPVDNVWIIATTNTGGDYEVDDIDPALYERFMPIRKDTTVSSLRTILTKVLSEKNFNTDISTALIAFYERMVESKNKGLVWRTPTVRTLARAVLLANTERQIKDYLANQYLLWCNKSSLTGLPDEDEKRSILKYIYDAFLGLD